MNSDNLPINNRGDDDDGAKTSLQFTTGQTRGACCDREGVIAGSSSPTSFVNDWREESGELSKMT
jgi:hypothetical protein